MRTALSDIKWAVERLNNLTGHKTEAYTKGQDGKYTPNGGTYLLDSAYGGWQLAQMCDEGTGQKQITYGFVSKKEMFNNIQNIIKGIYIGRGL